MACFYIKQFNNPKWFLLVYYMRTEVVLVCRQMMIAAHKFDGNMTPAANRNENATDFALLIFCFANDSMHTCIHTYERVRMYFCSNEF